MQTGGGLLIRRQWVQIPPGSLAGSVFGTRSQSGCREEGPDSGHNRCGETPPKRKRMRPRIVTLPQMRAGTDWGDLPTARVKDLRR